MSTLHKRFLDTVALKHTYINLPPVEEFLSREWFKVKQRRFGKLSVYILNVPSKSYLPRMTLSQTPDFIWHLSVEVSFSAWQRGSNIQLCDENEIPFFLDMLSGYVYEKSGLNFDAFKAKVSRIDIAEDIYVGEINTSRIIRDVSRIKLNGFDRTNINDETIFFENAGEAKNLVITFYDKFKQARKIYPDASDLELARGILRQEVRLRTAQIERFVELLNLPNRTAEIFLTQSVAEYILSYGKEKVRFDLSLVEEKDWVLEIASKLPTVKAILIIGFILLLRRFGNDFYQISNFDFNKRSYQRYIKKCFDSGINPYE